MTKEFWIDTRDKPGLLIAVMRELAGAAEISFEGWVSVSGLTKIPGASVEETTALRRCVFVRGITEFDFLVLPLTDETVPLIWGVITNNYHLGRGSGLLNVQIAVDDRKIFGAYDNFHRECVVAYERFPTALLDRLVANGVIRSYQTVN